MDSSREPANAPSHIQSPPALPAASRSAERLGAALDELTANLFFHIRETRAPPTGPKKGRKRPPFPPCRADSIGSARLFFSEVCTCWKWPRQSASVYQTKDRNTGERNKDRRWRCRDCGSDTPCERERSWRTRGRLCDAGVTASGVYAPPRRERAPNRLRGRRGCPTRPRSSCSTASVLP